MPTSNPPTPHHAPDIFIHRWSASGAAERANYQRFLSELCDVPNVPRPDPARADDRGNAYVFEKPVTFLAPPSGDGSHTTGRIDLYKRGFRNNLPRRLLAHRRKGRRLACRPLQSSRGSYD
jgi:hypothetical protein